LVSPNEVITGVVKHRAEAVEVKDRDRVLLTDQKGQRLKFGPRVREHLLVFGEGCSGPTTPATDYKVTHQASLVSVDA